MKFSWRGTVRNHKLSVYFYSSDKDNMFASALEKIKEDFPELKKLGDRSYVMIMDKTTGNSLTYYADGVIENEKQADEFCSLKINEWIDSCELKK